MRRWRNGERILERIRTSTSYKSYTPFPDRDRLMDQEDSTVRPDTPQIRPSCSRVTVRNW